MLIKDYFYKDFDGIHYPDARKGAKYTYGVDFNNFLEEENGVINNTEWSFDKGLNGKDIGYMPTLPNVAAAVIESPCVGSYTAKCKMHYTVEGIAQHILVPLVIKVV
jgi:hypothetical protein